MSDETAEDEPKPKRRGRAWWTRSPEERRLREIDEAAAKLGILPPKRNDKRLHEL
jgi:signal recognition particle subunit SEC65